jgi:hypothetical protein
VLTRPKPGTPFPPPPSGRHGQCASGISAQAFSNADGYPDFGTFWGNRIGFNLANPGTLADGPTLIGPYDATAHGIVGFAFDIDTVIPWERLRVAFPTVGTEDYPAYWMGPPMDLVPLPGGGAGPAGPGGPPFIRPGHYELLWSEVGGSGWGSVFDPTMIEAIQFQVLGSETGPVQFDFCVDNITLLRN